MKKNKFELSYREQSIMDLLWKNETGLTSVDLLEQLTDIVENATYVHRALNSLIAKGFITECGSVRYNKQYARKFKPALTKEEYMANLMLEKGVHMNSLSGIALAFVKQHPDNNSEKKSMVISELKQIIEQLEREP